MFFLHTLSSLEFTMALGGGVHFLTYFHECLLFELFLKVVIFYRQVLAIMGRGLFLTH